MWCYGVKQEGDGIECKKWVCALAGSQQQAAKDQSPAKHAITFTPKVHTKSGSFGKIEKELESISISIELEAIELLVGTV
jgi:hypothetical protein